MDLYRIIRETIIDAFPDLAGEDFDIQPTPENQQGDLGLACFRFAKAMRKAPQQIAAGFAGLSFPAPVATVEAVGPYCNFTLDRDAFAADLIGRVMDEGDCFGSSGEGKGKTVLLEHTSINPNASPHIGRSRNGLIGDTLARLLRFQGYDVDVHYYVNDMGKQIGLLVMESEGRDDISFHEILDMYVRANKRAESDPEFENRGFELLMKMEHHDPETAAAFKRIVDICLNGQLGVLSRLGLSYDSYDYESHYLGDPRMDAVLAMLEEKGALFTDDQGRTVADLQPLGYGPEEGRYIVLKRANGSSMYMYRDIAYTLDKVEKGADIDMIVLGEDHTMYFEQMRTIVEAMDKKAPEAVHYAYILLKDGKMSTRKGTVVLLEDFLDEAIGFARERVDEQWPGLPEDERGEIARMIGIGAVRFTILSVRPNRNVIFDWETALSFTGDSGPYIQYSCTRISSILRKAEDQDAGAEGGFMVSHDAEWDLLFRLAQFPDDVSFALAEKNSGVVATAALDIARRFSAFYNACPVLAAPDALTRHSRLVICRAVRQVLVNALGLLGIEAPERM